MAVVLLSAVCTALFSLAPESHWHAGKRRLLQRRWQARQALRASASSIGCCRAWKALLAVLQLRSLIKSSELTPQSSLTITPEPLMCMRCTNPLCKL